MTEAGPLMSTELQSRSNTILVVAMPNSVHTARWLNMVRTPHLRFVLLPIFRAPVTEALVGWKPVSTARDVAELGAGDVGVFDPPVQFDHAAIVMNERIGYQTWVPHFMGAEVQFAQPLHLMEAVRRFRPALVHSLEVQMAGYLCLAGKTHFAGEFPPWLLSNWGSDTYLYRKLEDHQPRLQQVARSIDAYLAECRRDCAALKQMGFDGILLPPVPASGGMDIEHLAATMDLPAPSTRREILVKGYHGWSGRALHILAAIRMAAPALRGYTIRVIHAPEEVHAVALRLAAETGLDIVNDPYLASHEDALRRVGRARMTIGCGISDGISTTLLEAMMAGSFPIQSNTSCGEEWVENGRTGILYSPHDIAALAQAIERAASDDALVDAAAPTNRRTVEERWNVGINGPAMIQRYRVLIDTFAARVRA